MAENFNLETNDEYENFELEFGEVTRIGSGTSDFNALNNRPKYNDVVMSSETNIPEVPTKTSDLSNDSDYQTSNEVQSAINTAMAGKQDTLTAGQNITIDNNVISAGKNVFYGTCSTASATVPKVVNCADFTQDDLSEGTILFVKFTYLASGNFPTLNVNNTGAVATTVAAKMWSNNETVAFIYSNNSWNMVESGLASTEIYGITKLHNSSTSSTNAMALVPAALNNVLTTMVAGASPYSTTATYAIGDYCRNGDYIYRCNTTIAGGEAWNASHWDLMPSLQDQLDNTETWTFELEGGTTVTKKVVVR